MDTDCFERQTLCSLLTYLNVYLNSLKGQCVWTVAAYSWQRSNSGQIRLSYVDWVASTETGTAAISVYLTLCPVFLEIRFLLCSCWGFILESSTACRHHAVPEAVCAARLKSSLFFFFFPRLGWVMTSLLEPAGSTRIMSLQWAFLIRAGVLCHRTRHAQITTSPPFFPPRLHTVRLSVCALTSVFTVGGWWYPSIRKGKIKCAASTEHR